MSLAINLDDNIFFFSSILFLIYFKESCSLKKTHNFISEKHSMLMIFYQRFFFI